MTEHRRKVEFARLLDEHVTGTTRSHNEYDTVDTDEATELLEVADLLWEAAHGAPPLQRDPVAAMLGLVPDSSRALSGSALKKALQSARLKVSDLARMLSEGGWEVTTRDVFNWQTRDHDLAPPALIQAVAEILDVPADRLTINKGESAAYRVTKSVTETHKFRSLVERWALLTGTTIDLSTSALESRLAASVYRGNQPDEVQMLASLEELLTALESESPGDDGH